MIRRITAVLRVAVESDTEHSLQDIGEALTHEWQLWTQTVCVGNERAGWVTSVAVDRISEQPEDQG